MYQHVIVPFDGGLESRAALAPATDLAWRCGAKVVVVSTTAIDDEVLGVALKSQASAKSGADVDFWVDVGRPLDDAVLDAARHRVGSVICVASRYRPAGVLRRKPVASPLPEGILRGSPVPVLIIGPETDLSRGLPLAEFCVPVDGGPASRWATAMAADLAKNLRMGLRLVVTVPPEVTDGRPPDEVTSLLETVRRVTPDVSLEVIQTGQPAAALAELAAERIDAVIVLPEAGGNSKSALGAYADELVRTSKRAVLLASPAS